ncbi:MAG: SPOR domain-containing protein [Deltaproteobacteria bacterium]|nr:MAG: SPOR domain-containing protein [Deltaproteobacteria bacterium]
MAKRRSRRKKASKKYQIELTPLSILLWGGFVFFVLSWIFVLGILVGRGFLPGAVTAISDLRSQISTLKEMVSRDRSDDLDSRKKSESDPKLAFYEKLSGKKEEAKKEWAPKRSVKGSREEATSKRTNPPKELQRQREVLRPKKNTDQKQVVISQKAQPERKESGTTKILPNESLPRISEAQYTVQLASLGEKNKAENLINDLVGRGYPAYYYEVKVKGKTYYRVRCGRFLSRKAAGDYAEKLLNEAGLKGFVSRIE